MTIRRRAGVITLTAGALTLGAVGTASAEPALDCGPANDGQTVTTTANRTYTCQYGSDGPFGNPGLSWYWSEIKNA